MNKHIQSLWNNRHAVSTALRSVPAYPQLIEYGHQYSITLLGPVGNPVAASFSYNPTTHSMEGNEDVVDTLVKALVPEATYAELVNYSFTSLLSYGHERSYEGIRHDHGHFVLVGSQIRYRTAGMRNGTWKHLTDDYILSVNQIRLWVDKDVDAMNTSMVQEWVKVTRDHINKALVHLDAFEKELGSAE